MASPRGSGHRILRPGPKVHSAPLWRLPSLRLSPHPPPQYALHPTPPGSVLRLDVLGEGVSFAPPLPAGRRGHLGLRSLPGHDGHRPPPHPGAESCCPSSHPSILPDGRRWSANGAEEKKENTFHKDQR